MSSVPLTIDDLRDLIHKGESRDPLVFLEAVMNGNDPRNLSSIYELVCEIDSFTEDGDISKEDWYEVIDHVTKRFKFSNVSLNESVAASKTLAEYLYPKRKQVDINGGNSASSEAHSSPLTVEEIELFKEKFNDEF